MSSSRNAIITSSGRGGQMGIAVAEVRECPLGRLRKIVGRGHVEAAGVDHLTVFNECSHDLHGGFALCQAPTWNVVRASPVSRAVLFNQAAISKPRASAQREVGQGGEDASRAQEIQRLAQRFRRPRGVDRGDDKRVGSSRIRLHRCSHPRSLRSRGDRIMTTREGNLRSQRCGSCPVPGEERSRYSNRTPEFGAPLRADWTDAAFGALFHYCGLFRSGCQKDLRARSAPPT